MKSARLRWQKKSGAKYPCAPIKFYHVSHVCEKKKFIFLGPKSQTKRKSNWSDGGQKKKSNVMPAADPRCPPMTPEVWENGGG